MESHVLLSECPLNDEDVLVLWKYHPKKLGLDFAEAPLNGLQVNQSRCSDTDSVIAFTL